MRQTRRNSRGIGLLIGVAGLVLLVGSVSPGQGQAWTEVSRLTASDAAAGDGFGVSVAISGKTAIVGASLDDDNGADAGSAYLFDTTSGKRLFKLTAADAAAGDRFGWSVAISGTTAIVGAFADDDNGTNSGAAYLFDIATGNQLFKLTARDGAAGDWFGWSVGISGTTAIVGARMDDDSGTNSGSVYLFDTTTGAQIAKLTARDAAAGDLFGIAVGISRTIAIVGAQMDDHSGSFSGSAYLFDTTTGEQFFKLTARDAAAGDWFGWSVGISGTTAIVGAFSDDDNGCGSGSAYLFDITTGSQIAKLTARDAAVGDWFGYHVAISGATAIVGAFYHDASGSAYLFAVPEPTFATRYVLGYSAVFVWFAVVGLVWLRRRMKGGVRVSGFEVRA